jgi:hypothetical protein
MPRRTLPLLASLGAVAALGACEINDPSGISGFKSPMAIEGVYDGTVSLQLQGTARSSSRSESALLDLGPIDSIYNIKGTASMAGAEVGVFQGTFVGRDSSVTVRRIGPTSRVSLGWAGFLPTLLPQCDWSEAEVSEVTSKINLERFSMQGQVTVLCADASLNGSAAPGPVRVEVDLDVRKTTKPGTGSE